MKRQIILTDIEIANRFLKENPGASVVMLCNYSGTVCELNNGDPSRKAEKNVYIVIEYIVKV